MSALVTGATGFIGRHLTAELRKQQETVRAFCRDEAKTRQFLCHGEEVIVGDACDPAALSRAVAGIDTIYHCAAAHSSSSTAEIRRTNVQSVERLFEAVRNSGGKARVVLMSSINVLGNGHLAGATEDAPRRLTGELHVDLKIAAEEVAEQAMAQGLDIVILRPGLVYGPGDPHLTKMARAIYLGKFMYLGSRDNIVPLVHVSDMVEAMILAGSRTTARNRTYHITDGSKTTIAQLVSEIARVVHCAEPRRVMPTIVPRLANVVCKTIGRAGPVSPSALRFLGASRDIDIERARRELGFAPRVTVTQGIAESAEWLREAAAVGRAA